MSILDADYLTKNFDIIYQNVDKIENAKLICLGEDHDCTTDRDGCKC